MSFAKIRPVPEECALNAVLYCRFSSERQTENSIDLQIRAGREYCARKGFKIIKTYIDRALSGTTDERPEFQKMIAEAKARKFAFVVVYRFDRFARNRYDSAIYKKQLESCGVRVLSTEESVGTGDEGIILEAIYDAMAESYSRRLSRVVTKGLNEKARKGLSTGGTVPYSYKLQDHKLVVDELNAPAVRLAFELYKAGNTKTQVARELNSRGFKTAKRGTWTVNAVTRVLTNKCYVGDNSYNGIARACPAIVDRDLFSCVQSLLDKNKKAYGRKTDKAEFSLSGKLYCGECGAAMIGDEGTSGSGKTYFYYSCSNKKRKRSCKKRSEKKDFIEWYVCEQTVQYVLTPGNIRRIAEKVVDLSEKELGSDELKAAQKQLTVIDNELESLTDKLLATDSTVLIQKINERAAELEKRKSVYEARTAELKMRAELRLTVREVESYLNAFRKGNLFDEKFRRRLVQTLINCVYVFDDKIIIYYNVRGFDSVNYVDVLSDAEQLGSALCSDSISDDSPYIKLSEHIAFLLTDGVFGAVISRD